MRRFVQGWGRQTKKTAKEDESTGRDEEKHKATTPANEWSPIRPKEQINGQLSQAEAGENADNTRIGLMAKEAGSMAQLNEKNPFEDPDGEESAPDPESGEGEPRAASRTPRLKGYSKIEQVLGANLWTVDDGRGGFTGKQWRSELDEE